MNAFRFDEDRASCNRSPRGGSGFYRRDVDGLRGVAVLLVVLYHAGFGFPGGFLGVDVFFVISGYLITNLMLRDMHSGEFSLRQFWLRRIRRILPASIVLQLVVLATGVFAMLPADLTELSSSAVSHLLFSANIFFWKHTGYFDGNVDTKPLLHFWSLSVEEQFYLFYPFYLLCFPPLQRVGRKLFVALFLFCLALGFYGQIRHPSAAFYLLPFRAWELLFGGLLCLLPESPSISKRRQNWVGNAGLLIIFVSAFVPHQSWSHWFPAGLLPCIGAAIVIFVGQKGRSHVSTFLGSRPLVLLGMISYSLYLWHWPLLAFLKRFEADLLLTSSTPAHRIGCVIASVVLATVSYLCIEQPVRRKVLLSSDSQCLFAAGTSTALCLVLGCFFMLTQGLPGRFDHRVVAYARVSRESDPRFARSMSAADVSSGDLHACGPRDSNRRWLLFGDSHAMNLLPGLEALATTASVRIDQATRFATAPLKGFDHLAVWRNDGAEDFVDAALQLVATTPYECVILFAAWESYQPWPSFEASLADTVATIQACGKRVVFILPVPDQGVDVPIALAAAVRRGQPPAQLGITNYARFRTLAPLQAALKTCDHVDLAILDPVVGLTDATGLIRAEIDGEALYSDNQHLSAAGSRRVGQILFPQLIEPR